ncbi:roadblock/LC7 domain-containing protein [Streptomyces armeniacus]|uniref:Roadblock/LC7 domain-containing protein n=1 Tax=Streptomyces armeniacus TaxID=83291 RepID=A0A345XIJ9_9ACTN|nr:roadblock/LC7 domain-containing protein [Streptomyces armeniacus]AXK31465.1 roadblock/LC7 domain-containing protein [Streptomyces armeniacus]
MNAPTAPTTEHTPVSSGVRSLRWLLSDLVAEVPGLLSVAVVSADGLPMLSSDDDPADPADPGPRSAPHETGADLATIVSGLASLTTGASELMEAGAVKQTMVSMDDGSLCVMSISDGSLLGAYAAPDCDMSAVAYHMALFVGRAGHLLTPELRTELRRSLRTETGTERERRP